MKKEPQYVTPEETPVLIEKFQKEIVKLNTELEEVQNKYLLTSLDNKMNKRRKLNKLKHLANQEKNLNTRIQMYNIDILHLEQGTYVKVKGFKLIIKKIKSLSYVNQKKVCGIILLLPWLIGFCFFFAKPLLTTIYWSFNEVTPIAGGLEVRFIGFLNYINLFKTQMFGNRTFIELMTISLKEMGTNVVIIFFFSLLVAVVLNTKFKGHQIFKAIFFIPVVYNTTVISAALSGKFGTYFSGSMGDMSSLLDNFSAYLLSLGIGESLITFLLNAINQIFTIVNKSGIQILIFIAALQSIPKHLYEAAKVEGATTYECFWKITFPMVSSMFLPVLVFTIVDCFTTSELIRVMTVTSDGAKIGYGMSSVVAIIYFAVNGLIIALLFGLLKKVVYNNE